jgi:hypothetical protein
LRLFALQFFASKQHLGIQHMKFGILHVVVYTFIVFMVAESCFIYHMIFEYYTHRCWLQLSFACVNYFLGSVKDACFFVPFVVKTLVFIA